MINRELVDIDLNALANVVLPAVGVAFMGGALAIRNRAKSWSERAAKRDATGDDLLKADATELREQFRKQLAKAESEIKELRTQIQVMSDDKAEAKAKMLVAESEKKALHEVIVNLHSELAQEREARKRALEEAHESRQLLDLRNDAITELVEGVRIRDVRIAAQEVETRQWHGRYDKLAHFITQHLPQHRAILDSVLHDTNEFVTQK